MDDVIAKITNLQADDVMRPFYDFSRWPMPNNQGQSDLTIGTSAEITQMHKDSKTLISDHLSTLVVESTGKLIFGGSSEPEGPVVWLNHQVVAKQLNATHRNDSSHSRETAKMVA
jgi:hypothetical protein